jgi:hypothetical protein
MTNLRAASRSPGDAVRLPIAFWRGTGLFTRPLPASGGRGPTRRPPDGSRSYPGHGSDARSCGRGRRLCRRPSRSVRLFDCGRDRESGRCVRRPLCAPCGSAGARFSPVGSLAPTPGIDRPVFRWLIGERPALRLAGCGRKLVGRDGTAAGRRACGRAACGAALRVATRGIARRGAARGIARGARIPTGRLRPAANSNPPEVGDCAAAAGRGFNSRSAAAMGPTGEKTTAKPSRPAGTSRTVIDILSPISSR